MTETPRALLGGSTPRVLAAAIIGAWGTCAVTLGACVPPFETPVEGAPVKEASGGQPTTDREDDRMRMVEEQLLARDITDSRVITAMRRVARDRFVPADQRSRAYQDRPLPIGYRQTISQPYIVAYMTQALRLTPDAKVLEVGTGSGYQAAVLAELVATVFSIEIVPQLADRSRRTLADLGYTNVQVKSGDGYAGWPEEAPFDAIIVTAAPDHIPLPLTDQLAVGGRMIIPVGQERQTLMVLRRTEDAVEQEATLPVLFVPMTGEAAGR